MDGRTKAGSWIVRLNLTEDEVQQLIRSIEWAKQMDSHQDEPNFPQRLDVIAHRVFLQEILDKLYDAVIEQRKFP